MKFQDQFKDDLKVDRGKQLKLNLGFDYLSLSFSLISITAYIHLEKK